MSPKEKREKRGGGWTEGKTIALFVLILAAVGASVVLLRGGTGKSPTASGGDNPLLEIEKLEVDLGKMSVQEERIAEISLANTGTGPLKISRVRTSCMCTSAVLVLGGLESPEFNMEMHNSPAVNAWVGTLGPSERGVLRIIYRPYKMPEPGGIERFVLFETDDPAHRKVQVRMTAFVG